MSAGPYAALLFDLDGTLIDSMPLHHRAWRQFFAQQSLPFDETGFFAATAGRTNEEILGELFPALDDGAIATLAEIKEAMYREQAQRSLQMIPGAGEFLRLARARGLPAAICTASPLANLRLAMQRFGLDALTDTVTSPADPLWGGAAGQRLRGKPHPDIFLEAARRLGVAAGDCLVFEDAPLGIEAARRGGMDAVALTTSLPAGAFAGHANLRHTMADFAGFDLHSLTPRETPHA